MARVTHVKKAQQRYETVPVIDPETGEQKKTPVMNKRTGEQKKDKRGNLVFLRLTKEDRTKPKPNLKCDYPGCEFPDKEIKPGQAYKHITPRSGPYGGVQKNRHEEHPTWNVWEYSSSTSARVAQIQHEAGDVIASYEFSSHDDFDDLRDQVTEMARELLDEKQESLDNMPEGLAEGSMIQEQVEALESWVEEIEGADAPEGDDTCLDCEGTGEVDCDTCSGTGNKDCENCSGTGVEDEETQEECTECGGEGTLDCDDCDGNGTTDCEQCGGEGTVEGVSDDWAEEAKQAIQEALDNCQV